MMTRRTRVLQTAIVVIVGIGTFAKVEVVRSLQSPVIAPLSQVAPFPADNPTTPEKAALGKQLFFDPRLSGDNSTSCASCHLPDKAFTDGLERAHGVGGKQLARNTPTLLNVGLYSAYFWDGRAGSLESQALVPISSPDEMNQNPSELEKELNSIPGYVSHFQAVFGSRVTKENIARALAAFERTLISRNSPFDRFLGGDSNALSDEAKRGWELFKGDAGCIRCHNGPTLSDGKFYSLGVAFTDHGRGAITGQRRDLYAFRTPSLRDVARTAPFMHDGSLHSLSDVVEFYYRGVPRQSPDGSPLDVEPLLERSFSEISDIVAFLEALNGGPERVSVPRLP